MHARLVLAWVLMAGSGAACSEFGATEESAPADAGVADGGAAAEDASARADGALPLPTDAGVPTSEIADSGWVPNGGFEQGGAGCGLPWQGPGATLALDPRARSGGSACLFCSTTFASLAFNLLATKPGTYTASAWVKTVPSDAGSAAVTLRLMSSTSSFSPPTSSAEWTMLAATRDVSANDGSLLLSVESPSGCFLVDDVSGTYVAP